MSRRNFIKTWEVSISIEVNQEDEPTGNEQYIREMLSSEVFDGSVTVRPIGEIFAKP